MCLLAVTAWGRTWKDDTGVFSVEAEFVEMKRGNVVLKTPQGKILEVPAVRLSSSDRDYLKKRLQAKNKTTGAQRVEAALIEPSQVEFVDTPLNDAAHLLSDLHNIGVQLDQRALDGLGIGPDMPCTLTAKGSLAEILDRLLKPEELTWCVRHDMLMITTEGRVDELQETRAYRLQGRVSFDRLIDDITKNIAPESWSDSGGPGSISPLSPNLVIVRQSQPTHRKIEQNYAKMLEPVRPSALPVVAIPGQDVPVDVLNSPTSVEFLETPLADAAEFLSAMKRLTISVDTKALDAIGVGADAPVTAILNDLPMASVLSLLTEPLELTWIVEKGGVVITTPEAAESRIVLASYPVRGLLGRGGGAALVDAIETTIAPDSWNNVGGPANVRMGVRGGLDVRHTFAGHQEVATLLGQLK